MIPCYLAGAERGGGGRTLQLKLTFMQQPALFINVSPALEILCELYLKVTAQGMAKS